MVLAPRMGTAAEPALVRVGLSSSLVQDIPSPLMQAVMRPFQVMLENQTGLKSECVVVPASRVAAQLVDGKIDIAILHGFEFAWAKQKTPELAPLMIAINQERYLTAQIVTARGGDVSRLADLKRRSLAVPRSTRGHCHLFMDRECQAGGVAYPDDLARVLKPACMEDALDDVLDGVADAALVDSLGLTCYERRKPGRFRQLQVIHESPPFPAPVFVIRTGAFNPKLQRQFQDGLQAAAQNPQSRRLLQLWKLTSFEPIPDDYGQVLLGIVRAYPPPPEKVAGQ
jgi:ABC-type phosphate/phosphonate transport system substrate-binding protein